MKLRLFAILFSVIVLVVIVANSQLSNEVDPSECELVSGECEIFSGQCELECDIQHEQNIEMCNEIHDAQIHECNDIRKEEFELCKKIKKNKISCLIQAIINSQQCKNDANIAEEQCIDNADTQFNECSNLCSRLDSDGDGVPDAVDNCPNTANPNQADINEDGVGDSCDQFLCCDGEGLVGGNCFFDTIDGCREKGGAVMNCLPNEVEGDISVEELRNFTRTRANASDSALVNLSRDVVSTGVNNTVYTPGVYNCANFSGDLERNLTALGYNATWTGYWCYGGAGNPPVANHAIVDVHLQDGRTVFIEPQTNQIVNLDMDGDGQVEVNNNAYTPGANTGQTDDNCKISVFDNQAAAQAAGVPGA